jgi:hypothetical protein
VSRYSDVLCVTEEEHTELCRAAGYDSRSVPRRLPDSARDRGQYPLTWQQALVLVRVRGFAEAEVINRIILGAGQFGYNASVGAVFGGCDVVAWLRPAREGVQQRRMRGSLPERQEAVIDLVDWFHSDEQARKFIHSTETLIIRDDLAGLDYWPKRAFRAHAVVLMTGTFGYSRSGLLGEIIKVADGWRAGTSGARLKDVVVLGLAVLVGRFDVGLHLACDGDFPLTLLRLAVREISGIPVGRGGDNGPAVQTTTLIGVNDPGMWRYCIAAERQYTKRPVRPSA